MKHISATLALLALIISGDALGQSSPNLYNGQQPTAAQWNSYFAVKQDFYTTGIPISNGGTGATTLSGALANLGLTPGVPGGSQPYSPILTSLAAVTGTANAILYFTDASDMAAAAMTGDCSFTAGAIVCTETNGAAFGQFATDTPTQATAALNVFSSTLKGLVPLSGGGTTNFLRADGTFASPPGTAISCATATLLGNSSGSTGQPTNCFSLSGTGTTIPTTVSPTFTGTLFNAGTTAATFNDLVANNSVQSKNGNYFSQSNNDISFIPSNDGTGLIVKHVTTMVNHETITGTASGGGNVTDGVDGADTNISHTIGVKGTGSIVLSAASVTAPSLPTTGTPTGYLCDQSGGALYNGAAGCGTLGSVSGGTGVSSPTAHSVPVAEGASAFTFEAPGSTGNCLVSNGASADPTFQSCTNVYTLPTASTSVLGGVKVDGTTISISGGVISAAGASAAIPGYITGAQLTFATTTTVTVSAGTMADSTNAVQMALSGSHTLNMAASGAGGLDTGTIAATTWYAVVVINGTSGTTVMATKETAGSPISPTMPSGYTKYRYVGSIFSNGSTQVAQFFQTGQNFYFAAPINDLSSAGVNSVQVVTLTIPRGIIVFPDMSWVIGNNSLFVFPATISTDTGWQISASASGTTGAAAIATIASNTSAQIHWQSSLTSTVNEFTRGWTDPYVASVD